MTHTDNMTTMARKKSNKKQVHKNNTYNNDINVTNHAQLQGVNNKLERLTLLVRTLFWRENLNV